MLRNLGAAVLGCCLAIVLLEAGLRIGGWAFLRARAAPALATDHDTIRVLCLGESTTADMAFLGAESYPAQLGTLLGPRFQVVNGGVPGITSDALVDRVPALLDRHQPHIVVSMMGVNDGVTDPVFPVGNTWRVVKLATWAYMTWRPDALAVSAAPPEAAQATSIAAWTAILEGRTAEADALIATALAYSDVPMIRLRALGMRAIIRWQDGQMAEGDAAHAEFVSLFADAPRALTAASYRRLQQMLRARGIPLVAVQYPTLPVGPLRAMVEPGTIVVDTAEPFLSELRRGHARALFRDLLGGLFGHMTPTANGLLAERVAGGVHLALAL